MKQAIIELNVLFKAANEFMNISPENSDEFIISWWNSREHNALTTFFTLKFFSEKFYNMILSRILLSFHLSKK